MTTNSPDRRKVQMIIRSNIDWNATRERIWNDRELKPPSETMRGMLIIEFRNPREVVAMISPKGTIQLTYPQALGVDGALEILKPKISTSTNEKLWLEVEREIPLYDEAWDVYDFYEKGHLWHPPFCQVCMMEFMDFLTQVSSFTVPSLPMLDPTQVLNFFPFTPFPASLPDPTTSVHEWVERLHEALSWSLGVYVNEMILRGADVYEGMLPKREA